MQTKSETKLRFSATAGPGRSVFFFARLAAQFLRKNKCVKNEAFE
jgi:hypothetical protein